MMPYALQLVAVGLVWVSFHCAGMCGPIVAGLNAAHSGGDAESRWLRTGTLNVLAYQAGRAITYALLGAAAGYLGETVDAAAGGVGRLVAIVAGASLALVGGARLVGVDLSFTDSARGAGTIGGRLGHHARRLVRLVGGRGRTRLALFGAVMGFLPCMLMFWVLGLAASTGSIAGGAGVMIGLVLLTTPVLVVAGSAPLAAGSRLQKYGDSIAAGALLVSGAWLLLIGAAANGWIDHLSYTIPTRSGTLKVMFW